MVRERPRNMLTVDVEDYFHVAAFEGTIARDEWRDWPSRVECNTRRLLEIFSQHKVTGTFFVLGWVAERYPGLVAEIAAAGHEIACHGYSHALIYHQSRRDFEAETAKAKAILEDLSGQPVHGYRAASWSVTQQSEWALDVLLQLGFGYDSSIYPVRRDFYGMPGAKRFIHQRTLSAGKSMIEVPPATITFAGKALPIGGGGYFRLYPYGITRRGLHWINDREDEPFVFYIHPWEIDSEQPRVNAGWKSRFRHYINIDRCEERLKRLLNDFRFTSVEAVLEECRLDGKFTDDGANELADQDDAGVGRYGVEKEDGRLQQTRN